MRVRELRRRLRRLGCEEVRQSGSHVIVRCGRCQTVIPVHYATFPILTGSPSELAKLTDAKVVELEPGETWEA